MLEQLDRLAALAVQMDEGWRLANPTQQWQHVAAAAHELELRFARQATAVLDDNANEIESAAPLVEALSHASTLRVSARLAGGDDEVAGAAATWTAQTLSAINDRISVSRTALARVEASGVPGGSPTWSEALTKHVDAVEAYSARLLHCEAAAVSSALTIQHLRSIGVSGRQWVEEARAEDVAPLLYVSSHPRR